MALSARERRQWRELECQLVAEANVADRPATEQRASDNENGYRITSVIGSVLAGVVVVGAFLLIILAVIVKLLIVGVFGFALMVFGGTRVRSFRHDVRSADDLVVVQRNDL
jgi:hypothetical protein